MWATTGAGRWRAEAGAARGDREGDVPARSSLSVDAVDRWLATHGVHPVALAAPDAVDGERLALVSAAGALGWRPPLDELGMAGAAGAAGQLHRVALQLRPLVDAAEQHALDAIGRYAAAAATAAHVARLLDTPALATIGVRPGLFVAVDALAGAGLRTLAAAETVAAHTFGRGLLGAPPTLRATLLEVRAAHAAPAIVWRRALRRHAAAGLGPPIVRVRRLTVEHDVTWSVRVPVGRELTVGGARATGDSTDAFEAAWSLATEGWRALTLVAYAVAGAWAFD